MHCSPPGSSVRGISQVRILEGLLLPPPGDPPHPGIEPACPTLQGGSLPLSPNLRSNQRSHNLVRECFTATLVFESFYKIESLKLNLSSLSSPWKTTWPVVFFMGRFLMINSISSIHNAASLRPLKAPSQLGEAKAGSCPLLLLELPAALQPGPGSPKGSGPSVPSWVSCGTLRPSENLPIFYKWSSLLVLKLVIIFPYILLISIDLQCLFCYLGIDNLYTLSFLVHIINGLHKFYWSLLTHLWFY